MSNMIITREAGRIVPSLWETPSTEGIRPVLLNKLWAGYFEAVIAKFGDPRTSRN